MCDLIDLSSPDGKKFQGPKLASPLIPAPTTNVCNNNNSKTNETNSLMVGKRDSLDNNPFDMVLCKTTEYIQKKDDPFEIALEKALESKVKSIALRTCSVDFIDDFSPSFRKRRQVSKLNKTLDETSINEELNPSTLRKKILFNEVFDEVKPNSNSCNIVGGDKETKSDNLQITTISHKVPNIEISNADLSILNQSIMNDTLFEPGCESENDQMKLILPKEKSVLSCKVPKLRRSLSQGDKLSPRKDRFNCISHLALENLQANLVNNDDTNSILSTNSNDLLNEGFLRNRYSKSSVSSSLSNISAITRLNSVTSMTIASMSSDGTINQAFLESCSSERTNNTRCSEKKHSIEDTNFLSPASTCSLNLILNTKDRASTLTPNLIQQCSRLKKNSPENCIPQNDSIEKGSNFSTNCNASMATANTINKEDSLSNKLVDIDVFTPEKNCSKKYKNSSSDTSSDSVFVEENKIHKSILHEAKVLAQTFEEMALKTSSGSSIEDLISSNPLWTSELLPAFDDEATVDNLIELPASPNNVHCDNTNSKTEQTAKLENSIGSDTKVSANANDVKIDINEFVPIEKRITMATLLLDLKKLIETENNTQVNTLLENLETALGVKRINNTELLTTCLGTTNNLTKSPQKPSGDLSIAQNVKENSAEESKEKNFDEENVNLNDLNTGKRTPNRKFLEINSDLENVVLDVDKSTNKSLEVMNVQSNEDDISVLHKSQKSPSPSKIENTNSLNEKMALELFTTLAKLLTGKTEEQLPTDLIQNLKKALNSNNGGVNNKAEADSSHVEIQLTPKKSALKSEKKISSSVLSKSANRYSLNEESKKSSAPKSLRRSTSASHNSSMKVMPTQLLSKDKNTSQLKEIKKRFPSDPGLVNSVSTKKTVDSVSSLTKICNGKDTGRRSIKGLSVQREKPTLITDAVKSKLKLKTDTEITGKKGPMKAVHPVGNMQKKAFEKRITPPTGTVTPPKSHKIISSTPNSLDKGCAVKRSPRSKPVASSTPDAPTSKAHDVQSTLANSKKRNFSCDISPVVTHVNVGNNGVKGSPKRINKPLSPKRTTPKRRPSDSNIPKSRTPPVMKKTNTLYDVNRCERFSESLQHTRNKRSDIQKMSPSPLKTNGSKIQQSPLRESNKFSPKIKPLNLISKLRRHSHDINVIEKENVYI